MSGKLISFSNNAVRISARNGRLDSAFRYLDLSTDVLSSNPDLSLLAAQREILDSAPKSDYEQTKKNSF